MLESGRHSGKLVLAARAYARHRDGSKAWQQPFTPVREDPSSYVGEEGAAEIDAW